MSNPNYHYTIDEYLDLVAWEIERFNQEFLDNYLEFEMNWDRYIDPTIDFKQEGVHMYVKHRNTRWIRIPRHHGHEIAFAKMTLEPSWIPLNMMGNKERVLFKEVS